MKKFLFLIAAAALMMLSCTSEKLENPAAGQEVTVSLSAQLPENIATKTYSDGALATKLSYAVYDSNSKTPLFSDENVTVTGGVANIDLTLISGKTYDLLFWAQSPQNAAYALSLTDQTISIDYDKILANDDNNDAFYAFETLSVNGAINKTIELSRPFAQVNLGTNDLTASQDKSFKLEKTSIKATVANVLNLADGSVSGEALVTYAANAVPSGETFPVANYDTYLAMNYLLVGNDQTTTSCEFAIFEEGKTEATNTITVSNVPVKRNYRTNIYGSLLTDPANLKIEIKPGIGDLENIEVSEVDENTSEPDFYTILSKGGNLTIAGAREKIDFNGLTIAQNLTLVLEAPVGEIILGGNNETVTRAASTKPGITIIVAKDVKFPKFSFNGKTENYTIKGDLNTNQPLTEKIITSGSVKNFTVENVKATGNAMIEGTNGTVGLIVKNCVATELNNSFVYIFNVFDAKILNNTIAFAASASPSDDYNMAIAAPYCGGEILIEGNIVTKAAKHGIFVNDGSISTLTIKDNKISGVVEDGIKIDRMRTNTVVVTGNIIDAADYGVRFDRFIPSETIADITIADNTISIDGFENDGTTPTSAIRVRYRADEYPGGVSVNLTAKDNKVGANGIPAGKYVNFVSEGMTLSGDYEFPFTDNVAPGVSLGTDGKTFGLSSLEAFKWFAAQSNASTRHELVKAGFEAQTVKLLADIDLNNEAWTPIGTTTAFRGVFDGGNHTIRNLSVKASNTAFAGLFSNVIGTIKNVNLTDAAVSGNWNAAALVASIYGTVENCHVDGATVISTPHKNKAGKYDDANNVGGLVGHLCEGNNKIINSSVKNAKVTAYRDVAALVGKVNNGGNIVSGNIVENVTVVANQLVEYCELKAPNAGELVGRNMPLEGGAQLDLTTNTVNNVTVNVLAPDENGSVEVGAVELSVISNISSEEVKEIVLTENLEGDASVGGYSKSGIVHTNGATIDGKGNTLDVQSANGTWDCALYTRGGTIKNLTITGAFRGIFTAGTDEKIVIDGCCIAPEAYTISADGGNGHGLEVKNSTLRGWTSYTTALGPATFENCKFEAGNDKILRPYSETVLTDCVFEEDFPLDARSASVTLVNCKVGDTLVTAENLTSLLGANAATAIVK